MTHLEQIEQITKELGDLEAERRRLYKQHIQPIDEKIMSLESQRESLTHQLAYLSMWDRK